MKQVYGDRLHLEWRSFPLEQVNNMHGPGWKLWDQPDDYRSKGLWPLRAAEAARRQGNGAFERMHELILQARHVERRGIADRDVLSEIAGQAGLDMDRFQRDLADKALLERIAGDYTRGVDEHGVWGTPTLVFEGGQAAYLKMRPAPPPEESVRVFEDLIDIIRNRPYLLEVKRPR